MWQEYHCPSTVEEALELLRSRRGRARVIAGGTDLVIEIKEGDRVVPFLVDITEIEFLKKIELEGDYIKIGACVTHHQAASSDLVQARATALSEAALSIGSPQTRNIGTVAGNVVNAQPAADAAVALMGLGAEAEIMDGAGSRWTPVEALYAGIGLSKVNSNEEMVTALRFKAQENDQGSAFERLAQRKALALPILNTAVMVTADAGRCLRARIVVAPVAPLPYRCRAAEDFLTGAPMTPETFARAGEAAAGECNPRDSALRGGSEYRREMIKVLVRRALGRAMGRIG
ncbi:MAG: FAD binding domain-containing protein [Deltaproteobacteria bacterium]|nr:FAD binding domain-containing protein [Deltaproteobacteria bacterium]